MKLTSTTAIAILLILGTMSTAGCKKDEGPSQREKDEQIILTYIDDFDLDAEATGSGLYVVIDEAGSGVNPTIYDEVSVFYRGALTSGEVFDLTGTEPAVFPLSQVIEGWQEALQLMSVGDSWMLYIPADLAYGERGQGPIGPNEMLTFRVELLGIE